MVVAGIPFRLERDGRKRGGTSASTTRGGRREDSVPDERAKPKWHFIRFLPPLADIKLNLFQFDLSRVTTETLPPFIRYTLRVGVEGISQSACYRVKVQL